MGCDHDHANDPCPECPCICCACGWHAYHGDFDPWTPKCWHPDGPGEVRLHREASRSELVAQGVAIHPTWRV